MIRMTVREGGTVRSVLLDGDRVEIGSAPAAGLRLSGAGVSPRHCLLRGLRRGFEVLDLGSREGTILNGTRVSRAAVAPGDVLTLGAASLILDGMEAGRRAPPPAGAGAPSTPVVPELVPRAAGVPAPDPFEIQLYRAVRRSPPVLASVGAHGVVILLVLLLSPTTRAGPATPLAVQVGRDFSLETESEPAPPLSEEALPEEKPPEFRETLETNSAEEERSLPEDSPPARSLERTPEFDVADGSISVGGPRRPLAEKGVTFEGNPSFKADGSGEANRRAAAMVLEGTGDRALLRKLDARRVLVVKGTYDRVEDTLALLGIRHDTLTGEEVALVPLPPQAILIIDCDADPLPPEACKAVRAFVHSGGYLCTTDWGLENVLERAFPGILRSLARGGMGVSTQNEVVSMRVTSPGHELVRGIRGVTEGATWWVEDQAHPVEVVDRERVTVLAESPEFKKRYRSGVLAATFPFGKGKVLHLLGHAWQKEGNLKGTYALQRMLLNFLADRAGTLE